MQKPKPTQHCPIPGCKNRTWASRYLAVCGECARHIAHMVRGPIESRDLEQRLEADHLRRIIARQSRELRALRNGEAYETPTEQPTEAKPLEGVVYFLRSGGYIKIGWTSDLSKRMRAYSPDSMLLATQPGTRKDEHRLHKMFAAHRTHGREWYAMTPSLMHHIEQVAVEHGTPDPVTFAARPVEIPQPRRTEPIRPRGWSGRAS
jgi:hypothetical protein